MHSPQRQGASRQAVLCCVLLALATAQAAAPSFSLSQSSSVNNTRTKTVNIGTGAIINQNVDFSTDYQVSQANTANIAHSAILPPPPPVNGPPPPPPVADNGCGAFGCSPPPPNAPSVPGIQVSFDVKTSSNTTNSIDSVQVANLAGPATPAIGNSIDADQSINNAVNATTNVAVFVNNAPSIGSGRITGKDSVVQTASNIFKGQQGVQGGDAQGSNVATVKQNIAISATGTSAVYVGQKVPGGQLPPFPPGVRFASPPPAPPPPPSPPTATAGPVTNGNIATIKQSINSNLTHNVFHTVDLTGTNNQNSVTARGSFAFNAQANALNQVSNQQVVTGTNSATTGATNNYTAIQTAQNNVTKFDTTEATYGNQTSEVRYSSVAAGNQVNKGTNLQTISGVNGGTVRNTKTDTQANQNWLYVNNGLQVSLVNSTQLANVSVAVTKTTNQGNAAANKQVQNVDDTFKGTSTSNNVAAQSNVQGEGTNYLTGNQVQVFGGSANSDAIVLSEDLTDTQQINTGTQLAGAGTSSPLSGAGGTVAQKATFNQTNNNFANYTNSNAAVIQNSKGNGDTQVKFGAGGQMGTVSGQSNQIFQNQDASSSTKGSGGGSISHTANDAHQNELNIKYLGLNYVGVTNSSGTVDNTVNTLLASSQKSNRTQTQVGSVSNTEGTTGKAQSTANTDSSTFNTYDTQYTSTQTVNTTNQGATGAQLVDAGFTDVNDQNAQSYQYSENQAKGSAAAGTAISYSNATGANAATTTNTLADPVSATLFGQFSNTNNTGNVTYEGGQIVQQYQTVTTNDYQQGNGKGGSAANAFGAASNDANVIHYNDNLQEVNLYQSHSVTGNKGNVNLGNTGGQTSNQQSFSNTTQVSDATGGSKRNAAAQVSNRVGNPLQGSDPTNKYYTLTNGNYNYLGSVVTTVNVNNSGNVNLQAVNEQVSQQTNAKNSYQQGSQNGFLASRVGKGTVNVADKSAQLNYNGASVDNSVQLGTSNNSGNVTNDQGYQVGNVQSNLANLLQSGITNTGGQNASNSANMVQWNQNGVTNGDNVDPGIYNKQTRTFINNNKNNSDVYQASTGQGSQINVLDQTQTALAPSTGPGRVQQTLTDLQDNTYINGQTVVYQASVDGNTSLSAVQSSSGNFQQGNLVQQQQVTYVVPQRTARPLTVTQNGFSNVSNAGDNQMNNMLGWLTAGNATGATFNVQQGSSQAGVQRNRYNNTQLAQASSLAGQFGVVNNEASHTASNNKTANEDTYVINANLQGNDASANVFQTQDLVDNQENNQTTTQLGVGVAFAGSSGYANNKATTKQTAVDTRAAEVYSLAVDVSGNATQNNVTQGGTYVAQQVKATNATQVAGGSGGFNKFALGNATNTLTTNQRSNYTLVKSTQQSFINNNTQNVANTGTASEVYLSDQQDRVEQNGAGLGAGSVRGQGLASNTATVNRNDQNYLNITHQAVADNSNGVGVGPRSTTPPTVITSASVSTIVQGGNSSTLQNSYGYGGGKMKAQGYAGNATNKAAITANNNNNQTYQHNSFLSSALTIPSGKTVGSVLSNSVVNLGNATVNQNAQAPGYAPKWTNGGGNASNTVSLNVSNSTSTNNFIFNWAINGLQNGTINNSTASNTPGGNLGGVTSKNSTQTKIVKVPFPPPPKKPPPPKRSPPKKSPPKRPPPPKKSPPKRPPPPKKSPPKKSPPKRPPPPKKSTGRRLMYI